MDSRVGRWSIILLASALVWATLVGAGAVRAANAPPPAESAGGEAGTAASAAAGRVNYQA